MLMSASRVVGAAALLWQGPVTLAAGVPQQIVDPHFHFIDVDNQPFQSFLKSLTGPGAKFMPEDYDIAASGLDIRAGVHLEVLPDNATAEAEWVTSLVAAGHSNVKTIVAGVPLMNDDVAEQLDSLRASPMVKGIRYILDYDGPWTAENPTHANMRRWNDGKGFDFLRDASKLELFERGFAMLKDRGYSFDLQCAPAQLMAAVALLKRHPDVKVCIDHLGKAHRLTGNAAEDKAKVDVWRAGMTEMAKLPQVHVKMSMLGYSVPGWHNDTAKEEYLVSLVQEVIQKFGPSRCMFASNWHLTPGVSDSDGILEDGPTFPELYAKYASWVENFTEEEQQMMFAGTAAKFYRIDEESPAPSPSTTPAPAGENWLLLTFVGLAILAAVLAFVGIFMRPLAGSDESGGAELIEST